MNYFKFFIFSSLFVFSTALFGQESLENKIINSEYRECSLMQVIQDLQEKNNLSFSYSSNKISLDKKVSFTFKNVPLKEVLENIFTGTGIYFEIMEGQIILKSRIVFQTVRGSVRDKISKLPLSGTTVQILVEGQLLGVVSNSRGEFIFSKVKVGRVDIFTTYIGYEPLEIEKYVVTSGKEVVLEIEMVETPFSLNEIVVSNHLYSKHKPINSMALVSSRSFTPEETSRYPASFLDPARMAQSFAGVSMYDDLSNDIIIRGNSSKGLLWKIEGIEVPNPNHFFEEGSTGGAISMLSNNVLDNSDFHTSAFPAEYGNAISGVFDLRFRKGNNQKSEYALSTGLLGTEIGFEGPFSRKWKASYLVNYRYSTIGLLGILGVDFGSISVANFQDISFNIHFPLKKGSISFFGLGGTSKGIEVAEKDTLLSKYLHNKINNLSNYSSGMVGVKHNLSVSSKANLENIFSLSGYKLGNMIDTLNSLNKPDLIDSDTFSNQAARFSSSVNYRISSSSTLKTGIILSNISFRYFSYRQNQNGDVYNYLQGTGNTQLFQGFSQWRYNFKEKVILNAGFHFTYFHLSRNSSLEPRLGVKYNFDPRHSIHFGWGIHSRAEPLITYYNLKKSDSNNSVNSPNTNLKLTKSQHFVVGYDQSFSENLRMKIEAYHQNLFHVPVLRDSLMVVSSINSIDGYTVYRKNVDTLVNEGTGRNYGVELTLEKFFSRNYYFLLTTSLYESKFKVPYFHQEFNTTFSGNYAFTFMTGKETKIGKEGNNVIGTNGKIVWYGGKRFTPVDFEKSLEFGEMILMEEMTNTRKTSDYVRMDISLYYKLNLKNTTHSFFVDIQNVTNRRNTWGYLYDKNTHSVQKILFNGIIPNIYYKLQF